MLSTSFGLGIARFVVSGVDQAIGKVVQTVAGEASNGQVGLSPSQVTSLPFRAALLGINFSDVLVQTILEVVDGSVTLALTTIKDGMDLMDSLFGTGPYASDSQGGHLGQASETFREVWMILSREWASMNEASYPKLEGLRLFMAYIAIQFATAEAWERQRVESHCQLVGLCYEALDEQHGSKNAWRAIGPWPVEWRRTARMDEEEEEEEEEEGEGEDDRMGSMEASVLSNLSGRFSLSAPSPPPVHVVRGQKAQDLPAEALWRSTSTAIPNTTATTSTLALGEQSDEDAMGPPPPHYHATDAFPPLEPLPLSSTMRRGSIKANPGIEKSHQQHSEGEEEEEELLTRQPRRGVLPPPPSLAKAPIIQPTAPMALGGDGGAGDEEDSTLYPILDWRDEHVPFSRAQTPILTRRPDRMEKLDTPPSSRREADADDAAGTAVDCKGIKGGKHSSAFPAPTRSASFPTAGSTNPWQPSTLRGGGRSGRPRGGGRRHTVGGEPRRGARDDDEPNAELQRFLADSYRFSRFCSAMYGELFLTWMGSTDIVLPQSASEGETAAHQQGVGTENGFNGVQANGGSGGNGVNGSGISPVDHHFSAYTGTPLGSILYSSDEAATLRTGAMGEQEKYYAPRYYILDDAESKQIVLVLRGTKSLHDVMVDLTCDAADLVLDHETPVASAASRRRHHDHNHNHHQHHHHRHPYKVHGGFLKAARTMASVDTLGIQERIHWALRDRPDYSLLVIGHSLGAGIASVLALLWADPTTGLTPPLPLSRTTRTKTRSSVHTTTVAEMMALPPGRRVRCYAYGSPKVMCPRLSRRSTKIITSISYGEDVVGRLSLGSVRNIGHAMRALLTLRQPSPSSSPSSSELACDQQQSSQSSHRNAAPDSHTTASTSPSSSPTNDSATATTSIGLEIVQKVIRWRLTKEAHLLEEFKEIRRLMHREMLRYERLNNAKDEEEEEVHDDYGWSSSDSDNGNNDDKRNAHPHPASRPGQRQGRRGRGREGVRASNRSTAKEEEEEEEALAAEKCPALVPGGKVLWIRPSAIEQAFQDQDERAHPVDHMKHQFEWDPFQHDNHGLGHAASLTDRFKRNWNAVAGHDGGGIQNGTAAAASSPSSSLPLPPPPSVPPPPPPHYQQQEQRVSNRILYRMYATTRPENVFEEMLFSRRMWSDHLPVTYEYILAGKHAVPPSSTSAVGSSSSASPSSSPSSTSHSTFSSRPSSPMMAAGVATPIKAFSGFVRKPR
ncbi:hypothetical protein DFQ27_003500 [Actinomortierella ambigua]|uniref:sn-1-specific diacylglycerol lipase n=1 Tax=Actinomortierella ambigua TaxID=1343610 RepID=A0A9P6Q7U6_9FUNG|nr:hypothetical protein DFQ27_003500 [Actinomortierella ambigua]